MAAYGSFHRIFENQLQNKSPKSLLDTLSSSSPWNQTNKDHETPPFTEIFGELHFKETTTTTTTHSSYDSNNHLQLCTEGLGSESYYDLEEEDQKVNMNFKGEEDDEVEEVKGNHEEWGRVRKEHKEYPPAMTRMSFKTYREEGRLVLEEVKIPRREFLRASREDGRLKLKLVQQEDEDEDKEVVEEKDL